MSGLREGRAVSAAFSDPLTPGTWVLAWPGSREGEPLVTRTRSEVWAVHSGERVVAVEGYAGGIALTHVDVLPVAEDETPATPDWRERAEYLEELAEALDDLVMSKGVALDEERLDWLTDWIADRLAAARREGADAALAPVEALAELWDRKARELHSTAHDTGDMAAEWDADAHEHHARALRAVLTASCPTCSGRGVWMDEPCADCNPRPPIHKPFTDDGVTYCGFPTDHGVIDGCGEAWPCSTVRAQGRDAAKGDAS